MVVLSGKLYQRLGLFASAFILSISGIIMAAPLYFSQVVHATSVIWLVNSTYSDDTNCISGIRECKTIQKAIDIAGADSTIMVAAGMYNEKLSIDKSITLLGASRDTTTISGSGTGVVVTVIASGVMIKGFTIRDSGTDINADAGIGLVGGGSSIIEDNNITNNETGVAIMGSSYNMIKNNIISNSARYGVVLEAYPLYPTTFSTVNTISDNTMTANKRDGIYVGKDCNSNTIIGNAISGATGTNEGSFEANGIYFWKSSQNTVTGNTISSNIGSNGSTGFGIEMHGSSQNAITSNVISGNLDGLHIRNINAAEGWPTYNIAGNNISNNQIYGNTRVNLYGSPNFDFNVENNWWGSTDKTTIISKLASWTSDGSITPGTTVFLNYTPWCLNSGCTIFSSADAITQDATNVNLYDATLNGTNGSYDATGHSFWVSTKSIDTSSSNIPIGVYSTPDMGAIAANMEFTASLSSLVTSGVPSTMPAITPNTTYYYVAWSLIDGTWYPGKIKSFTTVALDTTPPSVNFVDPTPEDGSYVKGVITGQVTATDAVGMGGYYIRVWKNAFESGTANLVKECSSAPGGNLLSTLQNVTCDLDTTTLTPGKYVFSAQFLDSSSNWGTAFRTFYVDNTDPTATIDGIAPKSLYNGSANINVHAIDDNYLKTDLYIEGETNPFKTYTDVYFGLFWLGNGNYRMVVIDKAGNSTEYKFTIDKTAPTATVTYDKTAWTNGSVIATLNPSESVTVTNNFGNATYTFTDNGTFTFQFVDAAGNTGTALATVNNIDKVAPLTPTHISPVDNSYLTTANWTLADWSNETDTNVPVTYVYESSNSNTRKPDGSFISPAYVSLALSSSQISTAGTPQGTYYWHVRSQDALGNASAWSTPWKVTVDNTVPVGGSLTMKTKLFPAGLTVTSPTAGVYTLPDLSMDGTDVFNSLSVAVTDTNLDTTAKPAVSVDGNLNGYMEYNTSTNVWNYVGQTSAPTFAPGMTHNLVATFLDTAGNTTTLTARFTTDNVAPDVTITSPTTYKFGHNSTIDIQGTIGDATNYNLLVNGASVDSNLAPFTGYNWDTHGLASGDYAITLNATDAAGNVGIDTIMMTIDNTAPTLAVNSSTGTDTTPIVTGTTDRATDIVTVDGNVATVNPIANGSGTYGWSYTLPTQSVGIHTITVISRDIYGNAISETATVTIDQTPVAATQGQPITTSSTVTPNNDQEVLGASTTKAPASSDVLLSDANNSVKGASTTKDNTWNIFGLAWYWLLLIIAGVGAIIWIIFAAIRNNRDNA